MVHFIHPFSRPKKGADFAERSVNQSMQKCTCNWVLQACKVPLEADFPPCPGSSGELHGRGQELGVGRSEAYEGERETEPKPRELPPSGEL